MNTSFFPDLSIQLSKRRSRCVLDPNLALSPGGATLARLLAPYVELWVGPEIFNVIDSATLYQREPELLIWPGTDQTEVAAVPEVLRDWVQLREEAGRYLYWVGDALRESFLPEDFDESLLSRWEAASRTLDSRLPQAMEATGPLIAAMRDAAALCAASAATGLPRVSGRLRQGMARRTRGRTAARRLFPPRVHAAGSDRRYCLPQQGRDLRSAVYGGG